VNAHSCSITVSLVDYPAVTHTETFEVLIEPCVVVSYNAASTISDYSYISYTDSVTYSGGLEILLSQATYTQVPACGWATNWEVSIGLTSGV
jgi:hypothetical protein